MTETMERFEAYVAAYKKFWDEITEEEVREMEELEKYGIYYDLDF